MCRRRLFDYFALGLLASFALVSGGAYGQVSVTVQWTPGAFAAEPGWEIVNTATNEVVMCEEAGSGLPPASTVLVLPAGTYEVTGWDSWGDGWNGGLLSVTTASGTLFSSSGPPNVGYAPAVNLCSTAPNDPDLFSGAASLGTFTLAAAGAVSLSKTVGTEPGVCAPTNSINVPPGTTVYYCYTATNVGAVTLTSHTLVDDQLGTIFSGLNYNLTPGSSIDTLAAGLSIPAVISNTTTNTAVWTASGPEGEAASGSASATVTVEAPLTYEVAGIANPTLGGTVECVPASVVSGGSATCYATANAGYVFSNWSGDCSGAEPTCTLSGIVGPVSAIADFAQAPSDTRAIPTVGAWGLMLLSTMIGLAAYRRYRQRP